MITEFVLEGDLLSRAAKKTLEAALSGLAEGDLPFAVETVKVSAEEIRALNARTRGIDSVTDVLSFPSMDLKRGEPVLSDEHGEEIDEEGRLFLGSVVVSEERAREQAKEYGHSYARELTYLTVHGILHCLGYDHETDEDRLEMRKKEEEIMQKLGLGRKI